MWIWIDPLGLNDELLKQAATNAANNASLIRPGKIRPNAAGAMITREGKIYSANSIRGGADADLHPDVAEVLREIHPDHRSRGHGKCWEPIVISMMLRDGVDPRDAISDARMVRNSVDHPYHNTPISACDSCKILFEHFGIIDSNKDC